LSTSSSNRLSSPSKEQGSLSSCLGRVFFTFLFLTPFIVAGAASAMKPTECQVSENYPSAVRQWCGLITRYALKTGLHPDLVAALIWQESGGNPTALSRSGAVGLMQVMPNDGKAASFQCKDGPCFQNRPSTAELQQPEFNIRYGTKLLRSLLDKNNGNLRLALREYGPIDIGYRYADTVLAIYNRYRAE
jgi:soluble lytic murein transglycosylase-like protein